MAEQRHPQPVPWQHDVLALFPLTEDILHLESLWCLAPGSSPLMKLALWHPPDEVDQFIREFLLDFGDGLSMVERRDETRLRELALKDEVTGLYNRRFFSIRLEQEIARHSRLKHPASVVLVDLDGFKAINEDLGYFAGDDTLRGMAEILLRHTRGINVICRYGGARFAILLIETSKAAARVYADRIRYVVSYSQFGHGRQVTASLGVASAPEDIAPTPENLMLAADGALSAAKRAGKNRVAMHEDIGHGGVVREG